MTSSAATVNVPGDIRLAYESFGESDAAPLLLIMGLGCQMLSWDDEFCERLAARGFRVIRFDNRDVGLSTHLPALETPDIALVMGRLSTGQPVSVPYQLGDMAIDAVGLLDALGIGSAHIVGASMGGMIAQEMAIRHPARVRSLTSIMSSTGNPSLPPPAPAAMDALLRPTPLDWMGYLQRYLATWAVLRAGDFPEDAARDLDRARRIFQRGIDPAGVARQLAAVLASGSRRTELAQLQVPTLVIHGAADPLVPLACGVDTAEAIPGARLEIIDGMGHALTIPHWPSVLDHIASHANAH